MNIISCPQCGERVRSISIGWKCEGCNGFIDMSGQFHEHKDDPFMPPMTNADRIRAMSDEEFASEMNQRSISTTCDIVCQGDCKAIATLNKTSGEVCKEIIMKWLKQPAEEDT